MSSDIKPDIEQELEAILTRQNGLHGIQHTTLGGLNLAFEHCVNCKETISKLNNLITTTVEKATQERDNSIEELAKRLYVAKNEQRAIDMSKYGADIYAPITLEDCLAELKANHRGES